MDTGGTIVDQEAQDTHAPQDKKKKPEKLLTYGINDVPPISVCLLFGIQHLLDSASGSAGTVFIIHTAICGGSDSVFFSELLSALIFMTGLGTFVQVTLGIRMPIMEGPAYAYITPVIAMMATPDWSPCPVRCADLGMNDTQTECEDKPWQKPLMEISGSLMCAAAVQTLLGVTGTVGFLLNYISSLTVAVTVALLGISLASFISYSAGAHWGVSLLTFALFIVFSLLLSSVKVPFPTWSAKKGWHITGFPIFKTFPLLFALGFAWLFCYILTETGVLPDDASNPAYRARTDIKTDVLDDSGWFFIPYPGRYGVPTFGVGVFVGFIGSVIASTIESIGDYYAFSRACQLPPPPKHVVNRGIAVEGVISVFCGACGTTFGTTSYSFVAGMVSVTGMGAKAGWLAVGVIFMAGGIVNKLTAALAMVPDPVLAGTTIAGTGMITAVGLSCLQFVDLKSVRNLVILGSSFMLGLMLPQYISDNPEIIDTGSKDLDQVLNILLSTSMTVGGIVSFVLDNIIPGTPTERGLLTHSKLLQAKVYSDEPLEDQIRNAYDFPYVTDWLRRRACCRSVPFLPSYDETPILDRVKVCGHRSSGGADGYHNDALSSE